MWRLAGRVATAVARPAPVTALPRAAFAAPSWARGGLLSGTRSFFANLKPQPIASHDTCVTDVINEDIKARNALNGRGSDLFAIFHCGGKQYKATTGDYIIVDNMAADIGSLIKMEKVLMVGSRDFTAVGAPLLKPDIATIHMRVVEKTRSRREIVYKFKKRKRYRKKLHHRHIRVMLQVEAIRLAPKFNGDDGITGEPLRPPGAKRTTPKPRTDRLRASRNATQNMGPELVLNEFDHDYTNDDDLLEEKNEDGFRKN